MISGRIPDAPRFRLQLLGGLTLLRPDGTEDPRLGSRGRKLVLLAYLGLARRPVPRDRLATFLWGHRDDERARHSLRDALSVLRQALGSAIPSRREMIALAPDAPLDIDLLELQAAARAADHARVVELYRGAFLDGVYVSDAHEVTDWIAEERTAAERLFVMACAAECTRLALARDWDGCAALARGWLDADPLDAAALEWRLRALGAPDTPAALRGAIAEYSRHDALLARDDETPAPVARLLSEQFTVRLSGMAESVLFSEGECASSARAEAVTVPSSPEAPFVPARTAVALSQGPARIKRLVIAAGMGLLLTATAVSLMKPGDVTLGAGDLIVAGIESPSPAAEDDWLEDGLPRLLASSLIREQVPGVVDPSSVRAAARTARLGDANGRTKGAESMAIARRLGAATLVSGEITRGAGRYLLDLAVQDVASGRVRHRLTVSDTSLFGLVDQATARVLAAVDRPGSGFHFEDVETSSVAAYRAYVRALDRMDAGRPAEAAQLFDIAVAADSTFSAALQGRMQLLTSITVAAQDSLHRLREALPRARRRESDFDRGASAVLNAIHQGDAPRSAQLSRELVMHYPRDARAYGLLVSALQMEGSFDEAINVGMRALALDSAARTDGDGRCATCALYGSITISALAIGDVSRATIAARRAVALNATEPAPWGWLARALLASERPADAIDAATRALQLAPREEAVAEGLGWLLLETGRFQAVDSLIRDWGRPGSEFVTMALDLRGALLRERGQYDAAARANAYSIERATGAGDTASLRLVYASSLALGGDLIAAVRVFEHAALHLDDVEQRGRVGLPPALEARAFAWPHALLADALFLGGSRDTLRLIALADSIEIVGRRSGFGRDVRLHFHVRGLVAEIGGRWQEAERAFERARWGRGGWTRTNIELARVQIAQGRPGDAIATLHDTRFGTLGAMGRYAPRTEIAAALAEAFLVAHQPDSAAAYLSRVRDAWGQADAPQRRRLAAIERQVRVGTVTDVGPTRQRLQRP